ncbi:hypothetical protein [Aliarcobacter butzleri]|uniref:hypothetical protein n=1 Tax=Aliarcobacter butzleri TaxID=28197 RepID=UPI00263C2F43|nr:hypothetical protein [Aliarcobacter butzleri]MDN5069039.1 hypothetical protein [Aliarcobacter butzleri]
MSNFINKYIDNLKTDINKLNLLEEYINNLTKRYHKKNISYVLLKKRLYVAKEFLLYCKNSNKDTSYQNYLEGYLWLYSDYKYYLKDFIYTSKLSEIHNLNIENIKTPKLIKPKCSHEILKDRVITILQNPNDKHLTEKYIIDSFIGYFHWVGIPSNVNCSFKNIKLINNTYYFVTHKYKFYLPNKIIQLILFN